MLRVAPVATLALLLSLAETCWIMPAHGVEFGDKSLTRGPMAASLLLWNGLATSTRTLFSMPIMLRLSRQIGPGLGGRSLIRDIE